MITLANPVGFNSTPPDRPGFLERVLRIPNPAAALQEIEVALATQPWDMVSPESIATILGVAPGTGRAR